jgi:hypothetical protein
VAVYSNARTRLHNTALLKAVRTFGSSRQSISLMQFVPSEYLTGELPLWFPTINMR